MVMNWTDAREYCRATYGADLVAIESEAENNYLKAKIKANPGNCYHSFNIHLLILVYVSSFLWFMIKKQFYGLLYENTMNTCTFIVTNVNISNDYQKR